MVNINEGNMSNPLQTVRRLESSSSAFARSINEMDKRLSIDNRDLRARIRNPKKSCQQKKQNESFQSFYHPHQRIFEISRARGNSIDEQKRISMGRVHFLWIT
jgi:hypothetical protein